MSPSIVDGAVVCETLYKVSGDLCKNLDRENVLSILADPESVPETNGRSCTSLSSRHHCFSTLTVPLFSQSPQSLSLLISALRVVVLELLVDQEIAQNRPEAEAVLPPFRSSRCRPSRDARPRTRFSASHDLHRSSSWSSTPGIPSHAGASYDGDNIVFVARRGGP